MRRMLSVAAALVLMAGMGGFAAAQKKTVLPAEMKGSDPAPDTKAAAVALKSGRIEDAIRMAKLALSRDERYVPAMLILAKAYYNDKKFELSTAIIDIAKSIDNITAPDQAQCFNLLGFIALNGHDQPDRISATAAFKKATELDEGYANAWNNLAAQYLFSKNYDGAVTAAEKAAQLAPNFAKAQLNLGSAYRGKERYEESEKAYKHALEIDPQYADAYFNLGIPYLDAKQMPGTDLVSKLNASINYLNRYKQVAGYRLTKDDPADNYIAEARKGIESEQKRLERQKKLQNRAQPKAADAPGKTGDK
jgi:tetratricopeptide (TPR) repeat protein